MLPIPPSSVGKSSHDHDSSNELRPTWLLIQTPPSSPPELPQSYCDSNDRIQKHGGHPTIGHSQLKVHSKHHRSPSSDNTSPDSENKLFAFPCISPIMDCLPSLAECAQKRFRPFEQSHGLLPNALKLQFSRRCLESGKTDMSLADIQEGKDILMQCLKLMPKNIISQALIAKEADCKYKCLCTLAMAWVAEVRAQDKQLHEMLIKEEFAKYAVSITETSILWRVLVGCSVEELDADADFCIGAYSHNFWSFSVANSTLNQIEDAASCLSESKEKSHADSASSDFDIDD
ncbi:uncharacterized protein BJ212DRAFT_1487397 [Suillus subaureus]|uniref:Uncharacterized protein n=1 Tax=Suillus subaureus TaxID=48587 RepID=A0A9P7J4L3_9AGAM|nr:uncharacterized protein BJ212DRAFT_1487397 [Suillus subaureus]KAG1802387.1 hypothetical protein BJ212DRAFT_1487397 [Suillus subaureus]